MSGPRCVPHMSAYATLWWQCSQTLFNLITAKTSGCILIKPRARFRFHFSKPNLLLFSALALQESDVPIFRILWSRQTLSNLHKKGNTKPSHCAISGWMERGSSSLLSSSECDWQSRISEQWIGSLRLTNMNINCPDTDKTDLSTLKLLLYILN